MNRFGAFGIHLALSLVIFLFLAYLVVYQWYPDFFFETDGGWRGLRIIIFVDFVLGPVLTLVVYKAGKPGLRTDLSMIGAFQIACLIAGTWVVYSERPISVVYNDGRFSVMSAQDYEDSGDQIPDLSRFPGDAPKWVMVEVPTGLQEEADFRGSMMKEGRLISTAVEHYKPFTFEHDQVRGNPMDPSLIIEKDSGKAVMQQWLSEHGGTPDDYLFYNIASRFVYGYLAFEKETGKLRGLLNLSSA